MKGIILAGGKATRLYPATKAVSKQLLPVYDKPMIYYPLSVLMLAGINDILIITNPEWMDQFERLLGNGSDIGIKISYAQQDEPRGLAEAFIIGEEFIGDDSVALILGDNIFFGDRLQETLQAAKSGSGSTIFSYYVKNPGRFGVVDFDDDLNIRSIEEKPDQPKSNWVVTGLYYFDKDVASIAKQVKPSARGELEITDVIKAYMDRGDLSLNLLGRGHAWLDTGSSSSLIDAAVFIKTIEERQGLQVGCIEEVAYRMGFIETEDLLRLSESMQTEYGAYLRKTANEGRGRNG